MNLVAIARTKNECDIVEAFVRHTLRFVDRLVVQDNSEDSTPQILRKLVAEGLPLEIIDEIEVGDYQAKNATDLMRAEAARGADWIMPLDCDEFIRGDIRAVLTAVSPDKPYRIPWQTYVYPESDYCFSHRLVSEGLQYWKVVVPAQITATGELGKGAHFLIGYEAADLPGITLAHLPIRSAEQWALKATIHKLQEQAVCGGNHAALNALPAIQLLSQQGGITPDQLAFYSCRYGPPINNPGWKPDIVFDPVLNARGEILEWPAPPVHYIATLLKFCDRMACELGRLRSGT